MTLYRKYRPQTLSEIVGQDQVTTILDQAIKQDKVAHAYLFAGPRGTGKTSVARILAKALNCANRAKGLDQLPCNNCPNCQAINAGSFLDVMELDAASNRGIDEIRALKEQIHLAPAMGRYKVYILDEAHMLTAEAFNALLKTLEEPPGHVVFILCTTESHKIPVTIASRCQRFVFSRASIPQLQQQLQHIAEAEHIAIDNDALALIAQLADGGYRDGAMLLEQIATAHSLETRASGSGEGTIQKPSSRNQITRFDIEQNLGLASQDIIQTLITNLQQGAPGTNIAAVEQFIASGGEVNQLINQLLNQLRLILFCQISPDIARATATPEQVAWATQRAIDFEQAQLIRLIKLLMEANRARPATYPALPLELLFVEGLAAVGIPMQKTIPAHTTAKNVEQPSTTETVISGTPSSRALVQEKQINNESDNSTALPPSEAIPEKMEKPSTQSDKAASSHSIAALSPERLRESWDTILTSIRPKSRSVEALLRDCTPLSFDGTILLLQFWYSFHKKQLELDKNRRLVEEIAGNVLGGAVKIRCQLGDKNNRPRKPMGEEDVHNIASVVEEPSLVDAATEIFGGEFIE